jgi:hypothetical protein
MERTGKTVGSGVTRAEIKNMLEDFKIDILSSLRSQLDTLQMKKKREEIEQALATFCPRCRTEHPRRRMSLGLDRGLRNM